MAVYERVYRSYEGELTPGWSRFLILPRYALGQVFKSRMFTGLFGLCYALPLGAVAVVYLRHNQTALEALELSLANLVPIDGDFRVFLFVQALVLGFILTLITGPSLVSADLTNNGLPLYLCRPFTRSEYVLGKLSVLAILLSAITWVPGLILFILNGILERGNWALENLHLAVALLVGSWVWIVVLSLMALSLSAWVKRKAIASGLLAAIVLVGNGFAAVVNEVAETSWGHLFSLSSMVQTVWAQLLRIDPPDTVPIWCAWLVLAVVCAIALLLLARKVRACEVSS